MADYKLVYMESAFDDDHCMVLGYIPADLFVNAGDMLVAENGAPYIAVASESTVASSAICKAIIAADDAVEVVSHFRRGWEKPEIKEEPHEND